MKALLISINAKYIHTNNAVRLLKVNSDFDVDIKEYTIKDDIKEIIEYVNQYHHNVIGFSVYIWNVEMIKTILKKIVVTNKKIVLGGPEVSYEPKHFLDQYPIDYIIKGEGEIVFNQLLHHLKDQKNIENLPSIAYYDGNNFINHPIEEIMELDQLNAPYFLETDKPHIKDKIAYVEASRGCPYNCTYCLSSLEKKVRFFNPNNVKYAIHYLITNGAKTIKFLDRTFNANKNTLEIIDFIIDNNNNQTTFQFEITGDILPTTLIDYIHKNAPKNLFRFEIGIQSINEETNRLVGRIQDNQKLFNNISKMVNEGVIDLHLDLIAGLPKEDLPSFINTFDTVYKLGAKELQLGFLKVLRGTKLKDDTINFDIKYENIAPYEIISTSHLTQSDIKEIHIVEHMLEIYHNKGYFGHRLRNILIHKQSPYQFFKKLGISYLKKGFKLHRYQLEGIYNHLFDFLSEKEKYEIIKDYLERTNIKPKLFFDTIKDKVTRRNVYNLLCKDTIIDINEYYKHCVVVDHNGEYFIRNYKKNESYVVKAAS
jgi:radical SAM superfamily enzyme YgiQ (UPF0313 family)